MYFFAVPAVSMILVIYILGSLHILRWGTREKRSDYVLDDDKLSLLDRYELLFHYQFTFKIKEIKSLLKLILFISTFFYRCCGRQRDERGKYIVSFVLPEKKNNNKKLK